MSRSPGTQPQKQSPANTPQSPLLAALTYLTFSTALTLVNKYIFSNAAFNYPCTTLVTQSLVVVATLSIFQLARNSITFSPVLLRQMVVPCLLFTLYLFTNARALRHLPLPILSVLKSLAPMGIALAERIAFRDTVSRPVSIAMLLVIFANFITLLNMSDSPTTGYIWALLNVVVNIAHVLSLRMCLSSQFTPVEKTLHANLLATIFMLPFAAINREIPPFFQHILLAPWSFRIIFTISCFLAAAIGASIFWLVQQTSGSTFSFVGACNKFPIVILGAILFRTHISTVAWISVSFGLLAGIIFAIAKAHEKKESPLTFLFQLTDDPPEDTLLPHQLASLPK